MTRNAISIGMNGSMLDEKPTGTGVYTFNVINSLSQLYDREQRRELTVFTPADSLLNKDINIVRLPKYLQASRYGKFAALARFLYNTVYYPFQAREYDLLISLTTHGSFHLRKQIITIHDLLSLRYKNISPHQRFYFKYLLPRMVSRARLLIAVSETTKQDIVHFLNYPAEKIHVVYNGYDSERYHPVATKTEKIKEAYGYSSYFLAVGPTYPHKNFDTLLKAYKELPDHIRQSHPLLIAGGIRKYIRTLENLVAENSLENNVKFLGYVPIELMPSLYHEAVALVFPSLYEGFGIPLLEAMASGCPVLASDTSSMPEVCGEAALYFDPLNAEAITAAMLQIVGEDSPRETLIAKGLERCRKFSWKRSAESLKALIDDQLQIINPSSYDRN